MPIINPLDHRAPIVDSEGRPTAYFMRQWQLQREVNTGIPVTFTQLQDVPNTYSGQVGRVVRVNSAGTGLEFDAFTFTGLTDTPNTYAGAEGLALRVNAAATALEFYTPATGGGGSSSWTLAGSWTHSGDVASVEFTGLAPASELLLIAYNLTLSGTSTSIRWRVSTDNGASYFSTSGDYIRVTGTSGNQGPLDSMFLTSSATGSTRWLSGVILNSGVTDGPKLGIPNTGEEVAFIADNSNDIDAVQLSCTANLTGGSAFVYKRADVVPPSGLVYTQGGMLSRHSGRIL